MCPERSLMERDCDSFCLGYIGLYIVLMWTRVSRRARYPCGVCGFKLTAIATLVRN